MEKIIRIGVRAADYIDWQKLEPFQDDLKQLDKVQFERLRKLILDGKFKFAIHVWQHEGKNYIIDGHQRLFVIKQLVEIEGYTCPPLPVAIVEAENFEEAKRDVLAGASQYGKVTQQGLFDYAKANDISYDVIVSNFNFHEIDFEKFGQKFDIIAPPTFGEAPPAADTPVIPSSSSEVKQVNLLFNADTHGEFMGHCERLSKVFGTMNITDTVMAVIRDCQK